MNVQIKKVFTSLIFFGILFLAGCFSGEQKQKLMVINVLPVEYYKDFHIKDSVHVSFDEFEENLKSWNKKDQYVIYCADYACMSSAFAVQVMLEQGFEHVWEYAGGAVDWYQKKLPSQGPAQMDYLQGHNEPLPDGEHTIPVLTAEELLEKMKEFGLLTK